MVWLPAFPDINLNENFCSIIKREVHEDREQFSRKEELLETIKTAASQVKAEIIARLTKIDGLMAVGSVEYEGVNMNV